MLLAKSTWPEIEAFLKRSTTVVVPIGSNEQHGPTGLLGTDWMCPEIIAHEAQAGRDDLLIAPTFNIGMAQHHLGFPGTISLKPSTFMAAIGDWCRSLAGHGFTKIYFLNGHGGNVHSIEAAFSELYAEASFAGKPRGFACKLKNWWDISGVNGLANRQFPVGHGRRPFPRAAGRARLGPARSGAPRGFFLGADADTAPRPRAVGVFLGARVDRLQVLESGPAPGRGKLVSDSDLVVRAPFGGTELARIPRPSSEEIEAAVERAVRVFQETRALPTYTRASPSCGKSRPSSNAGGTSSRTRSPRRRASP